MTWHLGRRLRLPAGVAAWADGFDVMVTTLNTLGTAWIFVMMMLIVIDVGMRAFFNSPIRGVPLIITMSIVAVVFLQLADALRAGRLTRSDVLIGKLLNTRPVLGHWMQAVFHFAGVVLMVVAGAVFPASAGKGLAPQFL